MLPKRDYLVACHSHCKNHEHGWVTVSFSPSSTADLTREFETLTPIDFSKLDGQPPFQAIAIELAPTVSEETLLRRMKTIRALLAENGTILLIGQRPSQWDSYQKAGLNINYFLVGLNVLLLTTGSEPALSAANLYATHFNRYSKSPVLTEHFEKVCMHLSLLRSTHPELPPLSLSILANCKAYIEHRQSRWFRNWARDNTYTALVDQLSADLKAFHENPSETAAARVKMHVLAMIANLRSRENKTSEEDHIKLDSILLEGMQAFQFLLNQLGPLEQKERIEESRPAP